MARGGSSLCRVKYSLHVAQKHCGMGKLPAEESLKSFSLSDHHSTLSLLTSIIRQNSHLVKPKTRIVPRKKIRQNRGFKLVAAPSRRIVELAE